MNIVATNEKNAKKKNQWRGPSIELAFDFGSSRVPG
jgi:hypothetical protein